MWEAIGAISMSFLMMILLFGLPFYLVYKKWLNEPEKKKYPFRKPCIFTNQFGHLVMVNPDDHMQEQIQEYYKQHPNEARKLLKSIRTDERWND